mmetsp:Transcript_18636/g.33360  ORF Transcript_18636/g.33360 Transcript_18636/m.33360 type:complete len:519 (+) Transcript_18636:177-1733(+)|eukprot:CAMPEP_0197518440 /NCGR_PEP_ID=MMETSP1318-20131121/3644_1 /TAXON_ID=552666 /ORGANISM="Partenskyella glossopodia, Strain RCC365" /LENGTH=518 /DNA_ID=CAMNT_0043068793 /DNA_START=98 /DNA_END=1654 /DNA_ORIENTATION=-
MPKSKKADKTASERDRKILHRVLQDHPEFELTFDMQVGIRYVVGAYDTDGTPSIRNREPSIDDFEEISDVRFPSAGSDKLDPETPKHTSRDFSFKTYAPKIFRRIRHRFGISCQKFVESVCGDFEYLSLKTNSKSGQFFFYSHDKQYMLKTMTREECGLLMKILPAYYNHVMEEPNTLICRFYGMHKVRLPGRKNYFLIMESVFHTKLQIHQIFDLKGSLVNRYARRGETVYKDQDFGMNKFNFQLEGSIAEMLKHVINTDAKFLKDLGVIDYSLLVGIHYRDGRMKPIEYKEDRMRRLNEQKTLKEKKQMPIGVPTKYNTIKTFKDLPGLFCKSFKHLPGLNDSTNGGTRPHRTAKLTDVKGKEKSENVPPSPLKSCGEERSYHQPAHHGGMLSVDHLGERGNEIYFIGIVDFLTEYGLRKTMEHALRSVFWDPEQISCVEPKVYSNRFREFLFDKIDPVNVKELHRKKDKQEEIDSYAGSPVKNNNEKNDDDVQHHQNHGHGDSKKVCCAASEDDG